MLYQIIIFPHFILDVSRGSSSSFWIYQRFMARKSSRRWCKEFCYICLNWERTSNACKAGCLLSNHDLLGLRSCSISIPPFTCIWHRGKYLWHQFLTYMHIIPYYITIYILLLKVFTFTLGWTADLAPLHYLGSSVPTRIYLRGCNCFARHSIFWGDWTLFCVTTQQG